MWLVRDSALECSSMVTDLKGGQVKAKGRENSECGDSEEHQE